MLQGYNVTGLVRASSARKQGGGLGMRHVCGDVTDRDSLAAAVQGQDIVFHLAGCVKALQPCRAYEINEQGTQNVPKRAQPKQRRPF